MMAQSVSLLLAIQPIRPRWEVIWSGTPPGSARLTGIRPTVASGGDRIAMWNSGRIAATWFSTAYADDRGLTDRVSLYLRRPRTDIVGHVCDVLGYLRGRRASTARSQSRPPRTLSSRSAGSREAAHMISRKKASAVTGIGCTSGSVDRPLGINGRVSFLYVAAVNPAKLCPVVLCLGVLPEVPGIIDIERRHPVARVSQKLHPGEPFDNLPHLPIRNELAVPICVAPTQDAAAGHARILPGGRAGSARLRSLLTHPCCSVIADSGRLSAAPEPSDLVAGRVLTSVFASR